MKKMSKKQILEMIAALAGICATISAIETVESISVALNSGASFPIDTLLLTLVVVGFAVILWLGIRKMD